MRGKINPFTSSEFALLGLLYEKPTHGYDLHRLITDPDGIGMIWGVKLSNLYAQIDKLEKKGFLEGIQFSEESRPARTEYHITENGKQAFEEWLSELVRHPRDFRQEFMLRYFFTLKFHPENVASLCNMQRDECELWLANTKLAYEKVDPTLLFKKTVMQYRVLYIQSIVNWLVALCNQF